MASDKPEGEKPLFCQLRKGRWYWEPPLRLRRSHNLETKPLGADTAAAWTYARKLNKDLAGLDPDAALPGTVTWLFEQFFATTKFADLAVSTRKDYRWLARRLGGMAIGNSTLGRTPARAIRPRHADRLYEVLSQESGHTSGHYACRFARRVWKWAGRKELVEAHPNPWAQMELAGVPKRNQRWTADQVAAVRLKATDKGWPSIGLAIHIAYSFTHRQGDVLALTWAALDAELVATSKTAAASPVVAAAYPELATELDAERARQAKAHPDSKHVVLCDTTREPWKADYFRHVFREIADAAGLPKDLQFRDLRATALTEMADADVSILDMSTHSTHATVSMARHYSRKTPEQFVRAAEKRLAGRKPSKQGDGTPNGTTELPPEK